MVHQYRILKQCVLDVRERDEMNIWKVAISGEEIGLCGTYYGIAKKATIAGEKALKVAQEEIKVDKNFNNELYVSEINFVACKEF